MKHLIFSVKNILLHTYRNKTTHGENLYRIVFFIVIISGTIHIKNQVQLFLQHKITQTKILKLK